MGTWVFDLGQAEHIAVSALTFMRFAQSLRPVTEDQTYARLRCRFAPKDYFTGMLAGHHRFAGLLLGVILFLPQGLWHVRWAVLELARAAETAFRLSFGPTANSRAGLVKKAFESRFAAIALVTCKGMLAP